MARRHARRARRTRHSAQKSPSWRPPTPGPTLQRASRLRRTPGPTHDRKRPGCTSTVPVDEPVDDSVDIRPDPVDDLVYKLGILPGDPYCHRPPPAPTPSAGCGRKFLASVSFSPACRACREKLAIRWMVTMHPNQSRSAMWIAANGDTARTTNARTGRSSGFTSFECRCDIEELLPVGEHRRYRRLVSTKE